MRTHRFLAFDLGAESGRAVLGELDSSRLSIRELHRFANGPKRIQGHEHWDLDRLFQNILEGARRCTTEGGAPPDSLAVDAWGVDFGLLAKDGRLVGPPFAYRDSRTAGAMEFFFSRMPREEVYGLTGVQFLPFNTLFQLASMVRDRSSLLESASRLLFMPDLFHFLLTGRMSSEFTIATTSQIYDPRRRAWSGKLMAALGLPLSLLPDVAPTASILGTMTAETATAAGLPSGTPVIASASHDTASAVAAVPAEGSDWAYISSGTWSLVGIESAEPIISSRTRELNFTNEGGLGGRFRFLKNVTGLWLLQQCRKSWEASGGRPLDYAALAETALSTPAFRTFIDPDNPDFLNPADMPLAIRSFARRTGQPEPDSVPAFVRCILESLALTYRRVLDELRQVSPRPIRIIHIIGGGSQNELLCRFTAEAAGLPVVAGPAEATAAGNILGQALALGAVGSLDEIRAVMQSSFILETYQPRDATAWESAFVRFKDIVASD